MPNNLVYRTHDPAEVGELLEERVRADVGSATPLPYEVRDTRGVEEGTLMDLGRMFIHSNLNDPIATIALTLPWHRPATLTVAATRYSISTLCMFLAFDIELAGDAAGPVSFAQKQFVGSLRGGPALAERLNAVAGLAKRVDAILRKQSSIAGTFVQQEPSWEVVPSEHATHLLIRTLGRQSGLLIPKGTTQAGEVLSIAGAIEAAL